MSLSSRLKTALNQVKEPDCDPVYGTWEAGRVYPRVKVLSSQSSPWRTEGSYRKFAWVFPMFMPFQEPSCCGWSDQFAHIRESRLDTKDLSYKWCCSLLSNTSSEWPQLNRLLLCPHNLVVTSARTLSKGLLFNPCVSYELSATFLCASSYQSSLCSVFSFPLCQKLSLG